MLRKYRKTAPIKAERFDGSLEMMEKYPIRVSLSSGYFLCTLEGDFEIDVGDYIATGDSGEHWTIKEDIFRRNYKLVKD